MQKYRKIPIETEAFQFTKKMYDDLVATGKTPKENPIDVKLSECPDGTFYWNWHTKELSMDTFDGRSRIISVGNWITKEENGFSVWGQLVFPKIFEPVN